MFEVKVYDSSGYLKKVISVDQLNTREEKKCETPSVYQRNKRRGGPPVKFNRSLADKR